MGLLYYKHHVSGRSWVRSTDGFLLDCVRFFLQYRSVDVSFSKIIIRPPLVPIN